ncbi:peptidylprolyl isomerase [bacterium]|nr:peptidylprolyl isomerase [bacterium]
MYSNPGDPAPLQPLYQQAFEVTPTISLRSILLSFCLVFLFLQTPTLGQDTTQLQADYDTKVETWRKTIKEIRKIHFEYIAASNEDEARKLRKDWGQLREVGRQQLVDLAQSARDLFDQLDTPPRDLVAFMHRIQSKLLFDGRPLQAYDIGHMILKKMPNDKEAQMITAKAAIRLNHFEEAGQLSESLGVAMQRGLDRVDTSMFSQIEDLKASYQRELEIQAAETETDTLPRVRLVTNKGEIIVELFENEAPTAVGNFLSLVEQEKYNDMLFNRVIKDVLALTGQYYRDGGFAPVVYTIKDECDREDARSHFRGSLSMAKTDDANSGYIQFFVCERALPHLDGKHTVFGRIISGEEVFESLSVSHFTTEENKEEKLPNVVHDYIISAEVLRKRDHEYSFEKSSGR